MIFDIENSLWKSDFDDQSGDGFTKFDNYV